MDKTSSYKLLYLLNMLTQGECTKNQIVEQFEKINMPITKSLITKYVEQFSEYGIEIKSKTNNERENVYYLEADDTVLEFSEEELNVISDVKKLLISQKDYNKIRKIMRLFYKIARHINNKEIQRDFIDFGYFSTVNWFLVRQLEKHCEEKNIITLEYIMPQGECKLITLHVDCLKISDWSQRLYLHGVFSGSKHFSHLPVDRIFMVKNVVKRNQLLDVTTNTLTYTVSKDLYTNSFEDEKETIIEDNGEKLTIERVIDDEFYLMQRLLSFCPEIYYISDEKIKKLFQEKLEILKALYEHGID